MPGRVGREIAFMFVKFHVGIHFVGVACCMPACVEMKMHLLSFQTGNLKKKANNEVVTEWYLFHSGKNKTLPWEEVGRCRQLTS